MEESNTKTHIIVNGVLGILIFVLNSLSLVSIFLSRSFPKRQKVVFFSLVASGMILGMHVLSVRLLHIHSISEYNLCQCRLFAAITLIFATILSNLLITIERFLSIILPMNLYKKITWKKLTVFTICLWSLSGLLTFSCFPGGFGGPICQFIVSGNQNGFDGPVCQFIVTANSSGTTNSNGYVFLGSFILVAFLINVIMYAYIVKVIRRHIRQISTTIVGNIPVIDERRSFQIKAELRMTVTVGIIVGMFGVSYCPAAVYLTYCEHFVSSEFTVETKGKTTFTTVVTLFMINSVINPVIYILRLKNCRQEMVARILCRPQPQFDNMVF